MASDSEASDQEDLNDALVQLPAERLQDDMDLIQEMEMDRRLWGKHHG